MVEMSEQTSEHEALTSLGMSIRDAGRLLRRRAIDLAEVQHLIRDLGCPPSLAADILLWADELDSAPVRRELQATA